MTDKVSRIAIICALEETIRDEVKRMCDTDILAELDTMALHAKENIENLRSVKYKTLVKESAEVVKDLVKGEPNSSEKPNNCEDLQDWKDRMWAEAIVTEPTISKMEQVEEPMKTTDYCDICKRDMCELCVADATNPYCVPSHYEINYEPKDEPITQTKTQNSNLTFEKADERCKGCNHYKLTCDLFSEICEFEPKDEPQPTTDCRQTDCAWK